MVSGDLVIYADDFRLQTSSPLIDGMTGLQSWSISGVNKGSEDADVRLSARCAEVVIGPCDNHK